MLGVVGTCCVRLHGPLIKNWQLIFWSDGVGGRAFDHDSRNGGRGICQQNCPQGRAFDQFFQMPGVFPGGGMLTAGIDSHIKVFIFVHFIDCCQLVENILQKHNFWFNSDLHFFIHCYVC